MNNPVAFAHIEDFLRKVSRNAFDKFGKSINWKEDGKNTVADIGCGPATILKDVIIPQIPSFSTSTVYGLDISPEMIEACSKKFSDLPNVKFAQMDVMNMEKFVESYGQVDLGLCFMVLHSLKDHKTALNSIRNIIKPGGQFLFTMFAFHNQFFAYEKMLEHPKWGGYLTKMFDFVSPYYNSNNPEQDFKNALESAGFVNIEIDSFTDKIEFAKAADYKAILKSGQPKLGKIPVELQDQYLDDFVETGVKNNLIQIDSETGRLIMDFRLMTVFGNNK